MATIRDVAHEAQVSVATVSRVINNKDAVSDEAIQRVKAAIKKLKYEPNILARNFRRSESRVILLLTPNLTNPYYASILMGIGNESRFRGYSCMICTTGGSAEEEREYLSMCTKKRADGAIMLATVSDRDDIERFAIGCPLVQCCEFHPGTGVAHVSVDSYVGAVKAVEYLLELGHRRIATISSVNTYQSTARRREGYHAALAQAGIISDPDLVRYGSVDYSFQSGVLAARSLLALEDRPTAIFCISDTLALGAIHAAEELGLRVPEDVSVVGFDDVEYATTFHPYITTMRQPCYDLGVHSASLLYQLIQGDEDIPREVVLDCELVVRESTARRLS